MPRLTPFFLPALLAACAGARVETPVPTSHVQQDAPRGPGVPALPEWCRVLDATEGAAGLPRRIRDARTGIVLRLVIPGRFVMGEEGASKESTPHEVAITRPFYLGETEVTLGQWQRFVRDSGHVSDAESDQGGWTVNAEGVWVMPSNAIWCDPVPLQGWRPGPEHPVSQVSWWDARCFCSAYGYRLPTEAEWEYACRAGTATPFWWGRELEGARGRENVADLSARRLFASWGVFAFDDGQPLLAPAGVLAANPWGFHDMLGNVSEWCADWYGALSAGAAVDPRGPAGGEHRVLRGGAWNAGPASLSGAGGRGHTTPGNRGDGSGFRVALSLSEGRPTR